MRITNKVMQNNALANINKNKVLQDNLNNQLSTGKKIMRPSEDPVVAIRALRLRTDLSQVQQFYKKNIPDAQAWLSLTESSINTTISVVKSMISECERGASDHLQTTDREKIIDSLKALRDEAYKTGDADYAGRYIFTGYRTDNSLSFAKPTTKEYQITEAFQFEDLEEMTFVDTANLNSITEANYTSEKILEQDVSSFNYYRLRLSYGDIDSTIPTTDLDGKEVKSITIRNGDGSAAYTPTLVTDAQTAYENAAADPNGIYLVPSTGELVMGKEVYNKINDGNTYNITYNKTNWKATDLRPEHYFYCESRNDQGLNVKYNPNYLTNLAVSPDQKIEYQVGFDQNVQVNTYASDVYKHDIGRDVDEIIDLAERVGKVEEMVAKFEEMQNDPAKDQDQVELDLAAAKKAETLLKDQLQRTFSKYITNTQGYLDGVNEAVTVVGNRSQRVSLAENRLSDQETTFQTLQSNNEDADATEVAVQLSSAEVSYEAALMATSKMIQSTLMNYL